MARSSRKNKGDVATQQSAEPQSIYRTAIYARLSVEDNGKEDGDSLENQIEFLEEYVDNRPYLVQTALFVDNGYTGTDFMRPEFSRMIQEAQVGKIDCVVVKDLSRLGRNYIETGNFIEKVFPFLKLRFIAVNDNYDTAHLDSSTELGASLKNIINDYYAKDISHKSGSALKAKRLRGDYIGNYAPHGYLKDPANKSHLLIDPEAAPVIRHLFELRADGNGISTITRILNAEGYPSPGRLRFERGIITNNNKKGAELRWNRHVTKDILSNVAYIGHLAQGRSASCYYQGIPFHRTSPAEWDVAKHTHEPIISLELWEKVQAVNNERQNSYQRDCGKYDYLPKCSNPYGKKLICADCGAVIKLVRSIAKGGKKAYAFLSIKASIMDKVAQLEDEKATLEKQMTLNQQTLTSAEQGIAAAALIADNASKSDDELRKQMYVDIERVLVFSNEHIEIQWKFADVFQTNPELCHI